MMHFYSAPTSPNRMIHFHSATTSPHRMEAVEDVDMNFNDFEFETSKRFRQEGFLEFETSPNFETFVPMAFADELFRNDQVMPLKPPPRVTNYSPNATSNRISSTPSLPRSPLLTLKNSFSRRNNKWNDEFDPFEFALEKVKEEKRVKSHHRRRGSRSLSLSPSRTTIPPLHNQNKQEGLPLEPMQHQRGPSWAQEYDTKKSSQMVVSPKLEPPNRHKGLPFGKKVRPMKVGHERTMMKPVEERETTEASGGENRRQKGKGFLRREINEVKVKEQAAALWKKLRIKLKENAQKNSKEEVSEMPKMEITPYRQKMGLCMSFRMESTKDMDWP